MPSRSASAEAARPAGHRRRRKRRQGARGYRPSDQGEPSSDSEASGTDPDIKEKAAESDSGSSGDLGSGPTVGITPDDLNGGGGNAAVMSGATFTVGLVTGLLIGWFLSG